jgi:hypothetical protein
MTTYGKVPVVAVLIVIVTSSLPVRLSPGLAGLATTNFISNLGENPGTAQKVHHQVSLRER